jgi:hypothetical protein
MPTGTPAGRDNRVTSARARRVPVLTEKWHALSDEKGTWFAVYVVSHLLSRNTTICGARLDADSALPK